jgi:predicted nuclease of predicted toxin-antitoxin system
MNFLIDACIPKKIWDLFTKNSFHCCPVSKTREILTDIQLIEFCLKQQCVLLTADTGFADCAKYPPKHYPGIIILQPQEYTEKNILNLAGKFIPYLKDKFIYNRTYVVGENEIIVFG